MNRPNLHQENGNLDISKVYEYIATLEKYCDYLEQDKDDYINYWGVVLFETKRDVEELEKKLDDAIGEICLMCGKYKQEHLGACEECRWDE